MTITAQNNQQPIYLSWGMGEESNTILDRWATDPSSRDFPLENLTVLTAQTGDEHQDTKTYCEKHILPLLRANNIRLVQVARAGRLEEDGIEVLDDSTQPHTLYIEGAYKLSDELLFAGTVPQFAGVHKCALKFKAFVLDEWLAQENQGPYRHAFGFNADETKRVAKSEYSVNKRIAFGFNTDEQKRIDRANIYSSPTRTSFYPLLDWGWNREACTNYLTQRFSDIPRKSACVQCPFVSLTSEAVARLRSEPHQVARALLIEYTSLCFNHRSSLYKNRSLMSVLRKDNNNTPINAFHKLLSQTPLATYRVRRIMTSKGHGHRCTEQVSDAADDLSALIRTKNLSPLTFHKDDYNIETAYAVERQPDCFPTREEFYVRAPATVASRARYGIPWFEDKWNALDQATLF
jgi:hypothetical protein